MLREEGKESDERAGDDDQPVDREHSPGRDVRRDEQLTRALVNELVELDDTSNDSQLINYSHFLSRFQPVLFFFQLFFAVLFVHNRCRSELRVT